MLSQLQSQYIRQFDFNNMSMPITFRATLAASRAPFSLRVRSSTMSSPVAGDTITAPLVSEQQIPDPNSSTQSLVTAAPPIAVARSLGFRPTPELGLLSHLFVLSMAFGAFFSVALVSIPTLIAFGRLGASVKKLSNVVSEEVPGTLSSLKLSSMELNDLTQQLTNLRHTISGVRVRSKDASSTNRSRSFRKNNPAS